MKPGIFIYCGDGALHKRLEAFTRPQLKTAARFIGQYYGNRIQMPWEDKDER